MFNDVLILREPAVSVILLTFILGVGGLRVWCRHPVWLQYYRRGRWAVNEAKRGYFGAMRLAGVVVTHLSRGPRPFFLVPLVLSLIAISITN